MINKILKKKSMEVPWWYLVFYLSYEQYSTEWTQKTKFESITVTFALTRYQPTLKYIKNRVRWEDSSFISKVITYHTHYTFKHLKDIQGYTYKWKKQLLNWKLCLIKVSKNNALFVKVKTFRCQQPCTFLHPSRCAEHGICLIESNEYSFSIPKWITSQGISI